MRYVAPQVQMMKRTLLACLCLTGIAIGVAGCATGQDRSPWHQYLHQKGLE